MAGMIKREDIDEVRQRARIDEVIGDHVTLRTAGVDSLKGLCPFHDERSPSFHVRPQVGMYHCFGCGESGDVFSFLQKIEGLGFAEAVERMAEKTGVTLRYEDGAKADQPEPGKRQRLLEEHRLAADFYAEQLLSAEAKSAREFLLERGFDRDACARFGVGYAPQGWDAIMRHLSSRGFTQTEITDSGLVSTGARGSYDRFRGRIMWPIRDVTGRTVGFGARRLFEQDQGPKYLNTPETALYKKNQILYGLDQAKRDIAKSKRAVIVEGYTDVMAAHLAGVTQAVATCGTAFGTEHVKIVRRIMADDTAHRGEIIFTFDGDAAGQKAALKAFEQDQKFVAQTYIAVSSGGEDPCDLRQNHGDEAVRDLVEGRVPLFEFALRETIKEFDLNSVEGTVQALRAAAPMIAAIRDSALRPGYERVVAGLVGVEVAEVSAIVRKERKSRVARGSTEQRPSTNTRNAEHAPSGGPAPTSLPTDVKIERAALQVALQQPQFVNAALFDSLDERTFSHPLSREIHLAMRLAGGLSKGASAPAQWPQAVADCLDSSELKHAVTSLAVEPLPVNAKDDTEKYSRGIIFSIFEIAVSRLAAGLHSSLQRTDPRDTEAIASHLRQLQTLELQRARLREQR